MTRSALQCPTCQTPLAWRRKGGTLDVMPGVAAGTKKGAEESLLVCPTCRAEVACPGVRPVLVPRLRHGDRSGGTVAT
jgi:endogenous inhibitor of DNA gyrase (YacG/DUF329 family)